MRRIDISRFQRNPCGFFGKSRNFPFVILEKSGKV